MSKVEGWEAGCSFSRIHEKMKPLADRAVGASWEAFMGGLTGVSDYLKRDFVNDC